LKDGPLSKKVSETFDNSMEVFQKCKAELEFFVSSIKSEDQLESSKLEFMLHFEDVRDKLDSMESLLK
jgi:hypothetical protein